MGALIAGMKAADFVMQRYSHDRELITLLTDSVALGLQFNHDINQSRRVAMKKELHKDYVVFCNINPLKGNSKYLFGNLSKLTKDIANKLTKRVRSTTLNMRSYKNFSRPSVAQNRSRRYHPIIRHAALRIF